MDVKATITVPKIIYDIYADAAKRLGDYSVEQVMSSALHAYAQYLFEEMQASGELTDNVGKQ